MDALQSSVGITSLLSVGDSRFTGDLKARYTDFIVREISEGGAVVRLTRLWPHPLAAPEAPAAAIATAVVSVEDEAAASPTLETALPADSASAVRALLAAGGGEPVEVPLPVDKAGRRALHEAVRAASNHLESETVNTSVVRVTYIKAGAVRKRPRPGPGGVNPGSLVPPYLHFTLHKVNMDTTSALQALARALGVREKVFGYAGTKDKRAATTQRVSIFRAEPARVSGAARSCRGVSVGDFAYSANPLHLGELAGNEFVITIRDLARQGECAIRGGALAGADADNLVSADDIASANASADAVISAAEAVLTRWRDAGGLFISYFGLQRFGGTASLGGFLGWGGTGTGTGTGTRAESETGGGSTGGDSTGVGSNVGSDASSPLRTHRIGRFLLAGDSLGALRLVLAARPGGDDDVAAAGAAYLNGEISAVAAAARLRNAYPSLERAVLLSLAKGAGAAAPVGPPSNGAAAESLFTAIPPALRLMYVHAYQSYLWNSMASARVAAGRRAAGAGALLTPLAGDLVFDGVDGVEGAAADEDEMALDAVGGSGGGGGGGGGDGAAITTAAATAATGPPPLPRVRLLTPDDIASGHFTLRDVVLPVPGTLVDFPAGAEWGAMAVDALIRADGLALPGCVVDDDTGSASDKVGAATAAVRGLFAARERRPAFVGAYRRLVGVARNLSWTSLRFSNDTQDLCVTDFEQCVGRGGAAPALTGPRVAMQIRLSLDKSHYATVALREVLA